MGEAWLTITSSVHPFPKVWHLSAPISPSMPSFCPWAAGVVPAPTIKDVHGSSAHFCTSSSSAASSYCKTTTGARCPNLFDKWHRIIYMPSHGPLAGKSKCSGTRQIRTTDLSVHSRTRQAPDHRRPPQIRGSNILNPGGGGVSSPYCPMGRPCSGGPYFTVPGSWHHAII